ncbi:putative phosphate transport protein (TIGR00153 family) [Enterococcus sp. PF1-24]|uniref:DUF47 domain-containing protein n=1 Tax=unclassified Enterococcus TaxID=2608891 RepID=UPI00247452F1|nr:MULTISPECIES: DUF47 family protein [unclassified Enterococcus]MDH6363435.1 putative phosphate transport protein (TIGR00153 family) [Enterococcus sp. PFB1-1]MDH6400529.1 putative phosphate transport protein (TIGR00153 family) [Enterococcus sp. PF1-24]
MARKKQYNYFDSLVKLAQWTAEAATHLDTLVKNYGVENLATTSEKIHDLEHQADEIVSEVMAELYDSFITPIDREDIVEITERLDDVIDGINSTTYLFENLAVTEIRPNTDALVECIATATSGLLVATKEFSKFKNSKKLAQMIKEVSAAETQADELYSSLTKVLFTTDVPVIEVIKWKDIFDQLENVVNVCEQIVDLIARVVIKNM